MLVLSRKASERIHIGEDIVIKVIKSGRSTVKFGIEAPNDVRVMRAELCGAPPQMASVQRVDTGSVKPDTVSSDQFPHTVSA